MKIARTILTTAGLTLGSVVQALAGSTPSSTFSTPSQTPTSKSAAGEAKASAPIPGKPWEFSPVLKSALAPGWGQVASDRENRGLAMGAAWLGGVFGAWIAARDKDAAYQNYLSDTETAQLKHDFDLANKYYRLQSLLTVVAASAWAWSFADSWSIEPPDRHGASAALVVTPSGLALAARF